MSIFSPNKEARLIITFKDKPYLAINFTKKGYEESIKDNDELIAGFAKSLNNFGAEIKAERNDIGSVSYGDKTLLFNHKGDYLIILLTDEKLRLDEFEEFIKLVIEFINSKLNNKTAYLTITLIPEMKQFLKKRKLI